MVISIGIKIVSIHFLHTAHMGDFIICTWPIWGTWSSTHGPYEGLDHLHMAHMRDLVIYTWPICGIIYHLHMSYMGELVICTCPIWGTSKSVHVSYGGLSYHLHMIHMADFIVCTCPPMGVYMMLEHTYLYDITFDWTFFFMMEHTFYTERPFPVTYKKTFDPDRQIYCFYLTHMDSRCRRSSLLLCVVC